MNHASQFVRGYDETTGRYFNVVRQYVLGQYGTKRRICPVIMWLKRVYFTYDLIIKDLKSDQTKILNTISEVYSKDNDGGFNYITPFCVGKEKIYIAKISTDKYNIEVFDFECAKKYQIQKMAPRDGFVKNTPQCLCKYIANLL